MYKLLGSISEHSVLIISWIRVQIYYLIMNVFYFVLIFYIIYSESAHGKVLEVYITMSGAFNNLLQMSY